MMETDAEYWMRRANRYKDALEFIRDVSMTVGSYPMPAQDQVVWLKELATECLNGTNPRTGEPYPPSPGATDTV